MGLRVNTVCPGPILTPLIEVFDKSTWPVMAGQALMNRLGTPDEIANAILFLSSESSRYGPTVHGPVERTDCSYL